MLERFRNLSEDAEKIPVTPDEIYDFTQGLLIPAVNHLARSDFFADGGEKEEMSFPVEVLEEGLPKKIVITAGTWECQKKPAEEDGAGVSQNDDEMKHLPWIQVRISRGSTARFTRQVIDIAKVNYDGPNQLRDIEFYEYDLTAWDTVVYDFEFGARNPCEYSRHVELRDSNDNLVWDDLDLEKPKKEGKISRRRQKRVEKMDVDASHTIYPLDIRTVLVALNEHKVPLAKIAQSSNSG